MKKKDLTTAWIYLVIGVICFAALVLTDSKLDSLLIAGAAVGLLGVGTVAQVNSITTAVEGFFDPLKRSVAMTAGGNAVTWAAVIAGGLTVLFSAMVLLGGADRISRVCSLVVPLMSAVYVLCSVLILVRCRAQIPAALRLIAVSAFSPRAAVGAAGGLTMRRILRMGIGRGVFTNEAGLGSTPIAAACSSNEDPVRQGLVTMTGTFLDTIVICSLTGLCLVVTGAWCAPGLAGFRITEQAWRTALPWPAGLSSFLLLACLVFFAFSTIIGWNFYGEQCLRYLTGGSQRAQRLYRWCYLAALCTAPLLSVKAAWELADILNACMALPNLTVAELSESESTEELARMLGGTQMTEAVLQNASELKKMASDWKEHNSDRMREKKLSKEVDCLWNFQACISSTCFCR